MRARAPSPVGDDPGSTAHLDPAVTPAPRVDCLTGPVALVGRPPSPGNASHCKTSHSLILVAKSTGTRDHAHYSPRSTRGHECKTSRYLILLAKSFCTRDDAPSSPCSTCGQSPGRDFANNIRDFDALHLST